jgi:RNA polymerase sigma-70 factor, ECF subfamily
LPAPHSNGNARDIGSVRHSPELTFADEATVVALAKSGDVPAFEELVKRRQSWLRNFLRRLCGDAHLADDLAQQTLLRTWRNIGSLKTNLAFGAWLRRMAVNAWVDHVRRHDALDVIDASSEEAIEEPDPVDMQSVAEGVDLHRALSTLAAPVRLCIVLSYSEGMSHSEISEATELPLGTVKSHISRGLERLQKTLRPEGS